VKPRDCFETTSDAAAQFTRGGNRFLMIYCLWCDTHDADCMDTRSASDLGSSSKLTIGQMFVSRVKETGATLMDCVSHACSSGSLIVSVSVSARRGDMISCILNARAVKRRSTEYYRTTKTYNARPMAAAAAAAIAAASVPARRPRYTRTATSSSSSNSSRQQPRLW
jgi:hypothetical protein